MTDIEARDAYGDALGPRSETGSPATFPDGPTPAQELAWPPIAAGENVLLVSPTGTGKTLAGFLAILDRLFRAHAEGTLGPGLRCVYVSPLRSLGYDIERNLAIPLEGIRRRLGLDGEPGARRRPHGRHLGLRPPQAPRQAAAPPDHDAGEPLAPAQPGGLGRATGESVEHVIVDEVHALVPTKRGADLAVSLERLSARASRDPCRVGLSATCRPPEPVARFLVGPDADLPGDRGPPARGHAAARDRGRVADRAGRGPASRPDAIAG